MKKEQIAKVNEEILENFFKDMRSILYTQRPLKVRMKMLYAARYSATYFMSINNHLIKECLQEKS
ncbi:hypothetical protein CL619_00635 [archaeon]|nr:hypothetical protein [archaeon]|tara:strand:- start:111 stop:305 length:195 start_codon:yes stop_codon:yes gene_type:complete